MRKTKIFSIFASLFVMLGATMLYSCSKSSNEVAPNAAKTSSVRTDKSGGTLGDIHNQYLSEVTSNFDYTSVFSTKSERIDAVASFFVSYTNTFNNLSVAEKNALNASLNYHKNLVEPSTLIDEAFGVDAGQTTNRLKTRYNEMLASDAIDSWEHQMIVGLLDLSEEALKYNTVSITAYRNYISQAKAELQNRNYTENSRHGKYAKAILSIAESSANWWADNSGEGNGGDVYEVQWIALDVAGACLGAGWAYLGGGDMGWGALGGAIFASTGAAGKIVKYLTPGA
jgi:hypothetical protein